MKILPVFLLSILLSCNLLSCDKPSVAAFNDPYARLDAVRERKEQQLVDYMQAVAKTAREMGKDQEMARLFVAKHQAYNNSVTDKASSENRQQLARLRDAIEECYIDNYLIFHDVLFIDDQGDIFYTVRRKADYHNNVFQGELSETALSQALKAAPDGGFVDFENYRFSGEPSAFFIVPQTLDRAVKGWFVLQFSINKINEMFNLEEDLGRTGEVFLVNRERFMLTDSKFFPQSTVLRKHLSEENITAKFNEGEGHRAVIDYRGFEAVTSFKVVTVLGSEWLLVAKIDRNEIISEEYRKNSNDNLLSLEKMLRERRVTLAETSFEGPHHIEVDMDEFRRVDQPGEEIYTHGVRTCTAILFSLPGKFAYLAHISANDKIYGGDKTDLMGLIQKRIDDFDLPRAQKNYLQVAIISPRPQYTMNLVDRLLDWGLFLSQIRLVFNDQARHANIAHDYVTGDTLVEWLGQDAVRGSAQVTDYPTLGSLMEKIQQIHEN